MMMFLIMVIIKSLRGTLWVPYKFKLLGVTFTLSLETIVYISFVLWLKFKMCFIGSQFRQVNVGFLILDLPDEVGLDMEGQRLSTCLFGKPPQMGRSYRIKFVRSYRTSDSSLGQSYL